MVGFTIPPLLAAKYSLPAATAQNQFSPHYYLIKGQKPLELNKDHREVRGAGPKYFSLYSTFSSPTIRPSVTAQLPFVYLLQCIESIELELKRRGKSVVQFQNKFKLLFTIKFFSQECR